MELIAAVCKGLDPDRWVIGQNGKQPVILKSDRQWFQERTMGRTVVCGRKTLETFPHGQPLKGRRNLILSRTMQGVAGAEVFSSLLDLQKVLPEDSCIIGGGMVYHALLPFCQKAWILEIDYLVPDGTGLTYLERLDRMPGWTVDATGDWTVEKPLEIAGCRDCPAVRHRLVRYRQTDCQSFRQAGRSHPKGQYLS